MEMQNLTILMEDKTNVFWALLSWGLTLGFLWSTISCLAMYKLLNLEEYWILNSLLVILKVSNGKMQDLQHIIPSAAWSQ